MKVKRWYHGALNTGWGSWLEGSWSRTTGLVRSGTVALCPSVGADIAVTTLCKKRRCTDGCYSRDHGVQA